MSARLEDRPDLCLSSARRNSERQYSYLVTCRCGAGGSPGVPVNPSWRGKAGDRDLNKRSTQVHFMPIAGDRYECFKCQSPERWSHTKRPKSSQRSRPVRAGLPRIYKNVLTCARCLQTLDIRPDVRYQQHKHSSDATSGEYKPYRSIATMETQRGTAEAEHARECSTDAWNAQ
jgi:hypothetical protein